MTRTRYSPGETAQVSGQYAIVSAAGRRTSVERTIVVGEPFPPTRNKGEKYVLVDKTKH